METAQRPRGDRTDDAELERRIREVERLILRGKPVSDIVSYCEHHFGVSRATVTRYMSEANQRIKDSNKDDLDLDRAKAKTRYERFIDLAEEMKEINVAVSAQTQLVKLLGLAAPDKVEHDIGQRAAESLVARIRDGQTVVIE